MGLGLTVGILADLKQNDPEGADWVQAQLDDVNHALVAVGHAPHHEPEDCAVWWADGYGYSGLHALREVAGLLWLRRPIPRDKLIDGRGSSLAEDQLFEACLPALVPPKRGLLAKLMGKPTEPRLEPFMHLIVHSDAEGYYVPIDFPVPVAPEKMREETASIWPVGSVQRLADEVDTICSALEIPPDLTSDSLGLEQAMERETPVTDDALWQAQPIATHSALILREACAASMRTGAAIAFG